MSNGKTKLPGSAEEKASTLSTAETPANLGAWYLAGSAALFEPQRANNFKLTFSDLQKALGVPNDVTDDYIELSVKSSSVPHSTTEKLTINRGNTQVHYAGKTTFSDGKVVVHDYIGADVKGLLMKWRNLVFDPSTEKTGLAGDYKFNGTLVEYTPEYQVVRTYNLYGCWPSALSEADYDHDSTELKTIDMTLIFDKAVLDTSSSTTEA